MQQPYREDSMHSHRQQPYQSYSGEGPFLPTADGANPSPYVSRPAYNMTPSGVASGFYPHNVVAQTYRRPTQASSYPTTPIGTPYGHYGAGTPATGSTTSAASSHHHQISDRKGGKLPMWSANSASSASLYSPTKSKDGFKGKSRCCSSCCKSLLLVVLISTLSLLLAGSALYFTTTDIVTRENAIKWSEYAQRCVADGVVKLRDLLPARASNSIFSEHTTADNMQYEALQKVHQQMISPEIVQQVEPIVAENGHREPDAVHSKLVHEVENADIPPPEVHPEIVGHPEVVAQPEAIHQEVHHYAEPHVIAEPQLVQQPLQKNGPSEGKSGLAIAMSFVPWFHAKSTTEDSLISSASAHLTYSSFRCAPVGIQTSNTSDCCQNVSLKDAALPSNEHPSSNYGRRFHLQRQLKDTSVSNSPPSISPNLSGVKSPPMEENCDDLTPTCLQTYPGERLSSDSYVRFIPNGTNQSSEYHNRGSSVLAGVSVVTNTMIGVALLGAPWVYSGIGLPLGITLTFLFAGLGIFSMYLLSSVVMSLGGADESFYSLTRKAFPGHPASRFVVDSLVLVKAVGVGCGYLVVIGDMLPTMFGGAPSWLSKNCFRSITILVAVILFVLPASLPKRIRSLRFTTYISLLCSLYVTGVVVFAPKPVSLALDEPGDVWNVDQGTMALSVTQSVASTSRSAIAEAKGHITEVPTRLLGETPLGEESFFVTVSRTLPVFVFMFACAQNLLSITNELKTRTLSKSFNVVTYSVFCALSVYLLVGVSGSLSLDGIVDSDVLNCFDSSNLFVWTAKMLVIISVVFTFPLQCHPFRRSLWVLTTSFRSNVPSTLGEQRHVERQFLFHTTVLFVSLTTALALAVRDLGLVFQIVGAIGSTTMSYLMPSILYLKLSNDNKWTPIKVGAACLATGSTLLIPISLYAIIVSRLP